MSGGMFLLNGDDLVPMREQAYDSEDRLQGWLAKYPDLLAGGDHLEGSARHWLLVKREAGIPDREAGGSRWSLDHLFIDQEAVPILVEVKRSDDTRIRREVIGQMLDYAANGVVYWPAERMRASFEARCAKEGMDADDVFRESLGDELEPERFWEDVEQNLRSGRIRLVFVSDVIPPELRRVIEFLNERMSPTEVIGIEIRQYVGDGNLRTLVPRVVGQTEQARTQKIGGSRSQEAPVDWDDYRAWLRPERFTLVRTLFERIEEAIAGRDLSWLPKLNSSYFGFQRPGGYLCVGVDIRSVNPVDFWIRLPAEPDKLRRLGYDIPDLYPELVTWWSALHKALGWTVATRETIPDVGSAIDLASRFQPPSGPMRIPASRP